MKVMKYTDFDVETDSLGTVPSLSCNSTANSKKSISAIQGFFFSTNSAETLLSKPTGDTGEYTVDAYVSSKFQQTTLTPAEESSITENFTFFSLNIGKNTDDSVFLKSAVLNDSALLYGTKCVFEPFSLDFSFSVTNRQWLNTNKMISVAFSGLISGQRYRIGVNQSGAAPSKPEFTAINSTQTVVFGPELEINSSSAVRVDLAKIMLNGSIKVLKKGSEEDFDTATALNLKKTTESGCGTAVTDGFLEADSNGTIGVCYDISDLCQADSSRIKAEIKQDSPFLPVERGNFAVESTCVTVTDDTKKVLIPSHSQFRQYTVFVSDSIAVIFKGLPSKTAITEFEINKETFFFSSSSNKIYVFAKNKNGEFTAKLTGITAKYKAFNSSNELTATVAHKIDSSVSNFPFYSITFSSFPDVGVYLVQFSIEGSKSSTVVLPVVGNTADCAIDSLSIKFSDASCNSSCPQNMAKDGILCYSKCEDVCYDSNCSQKDYYLESQQCVQNCSSDKFVIDALKCCVGSCSTGVQECSGADSFIKSRRNTCVEECEEGADGDYCLNDCPKFRSGNQCVDSCSAFVSPQIVGVSAGGSCVQECPSTLPFYFEDDKLCRNKCDMYYSEGKECLRSCTGVVDNTHSRAVCRQKCTGRNSFSLTQTRHVCAASYESGTSYFEVGTVKYSIMPACSALLKGNETLTDQICKKRCASDKAVKVDISETVCVSECPSDLPYSRDGHCSASCAVLYSLDNQCLTVCPVFAPFQQEREGKVFCLEECDEGWLSDTDSKCIKYVEKGCHPPKIQVLNKCVHCDINLVYQEGKCMKDCSDGYLVNSRGYCEKCSGVNFESNCVSACPSLYIPVRTDSVLPVCQQCTKHGYFLEKGVCVNQCPIDKINRGIYCKTCTELGNLINSAEETFCAQCKNNYLTEDKKCISSCFYHSFRLNDQKYCLNCKKGLFIGNKCVDECPKGTVPYLNKRECLKIPTNCGTESHFCLRGSKCENSKCVCKLGTTGILCQATLSEAKEEFDPRILEQWTSLKQVDIQALSNLNMLSGDSIPTENTLSSLQKLTEEALKSNKTEEYINLLDFSLKSAPFLIDDSSRRAALVNQFFKANLTSRRLLLEEKQISFEGQTISISTGQNINDTVDLAQCSKALAEKLNLKENQFTFQYVEIKGSSTFLNQVSTEKRLLVSNSPLVVVSLYVEGVLKDINLGCSISNISVQFDVSPGDSAEKLEEMSNREIDIFSLNDPFFTDICTLDNKFSDTTLSKRKETYYMNPAKYCNQKPSQKCKVIEFSGRKIKCKCFGEDTEQPGNSTSSGIMQNNIRLLACYTEMFTDKMHSNPGLLLSSAVLLIFYLLQNLSLWYTIKRLKTNKLSIYLKNSLFVLDNTSFSTEEYFSHCKRVINVEKSDSHNKIENDSNQPLAKSSSSRIVEDLSTVKPLDVSYLDNGKLSGISPTNVDFDSLSADQLKRLDKRPLWFVFKLEIMKNHAYFNCFSYDSLVFPLHLRLFLLMAFLLVNMALNALFYSDSMIDAKTVTAEGGLGYALETQSSKIILSLLFAYLTEGVIRYLVRIPVRWRFEFNLSMLTADKKVVIDA